MFTRNSNSTAALSISARCLRWPSPCRAMGQENLNPPPDDDLIGKKCPHELAFIHYQIYYYSIVKDCSDTSTAPYLAGFQNPVRDRMQSSRRL